MAITIKKYVDITSGVGGGAGVKSRELIGRMVTKNPLLAVGVLAEFTTLDSVGAFFGTTSEEYKRATSYFAFINKNISSAKKLSFTRWADVAVAPMVLGTTSVKNLTAIKALTAAAFNVVVTANGTPTTLAVTALDLSGAASLTAVAALLQTAIRAKVNPQTTNATVTYNTTTNVFTLTGGTTGQADTITITAGATNDVAALLGWLASQGAMSTAGAAAQSPLDAISNSAQASDNFGSFLFLTSATLTAVQIKDIAAWNDAQNVKFMYCLGVALADTATYYADLKGYSGCAVTLIDATVADFQEQCPMEILATTDYERINAVQNYMYYQFPTRKALVTDTTISNQLDAIRINYNGQTQTAGQKLEFYQRGTLMGGTTAPIDMNTYANEMWLKDDILATIMSVFLSLARVSANIDGEALLISNIQASIDRGLRNGVISVGKLLNSVQKSYIGQQTGDPKAWRQVQDVGYWFNIDMVSYVTESGATEYKAKYLLIYSKDDVVRKVEGSNILI